MRATYGHYHTPFLGRADPQLRAVLSELGGRSDQHQLILRFSFSAINCDFRAMNI
jgi:hypothetical protein